jgi:putative glycosyltransferase (TIGR04348 family)
VNVVIVSPAAVHTTLGNSITANRWAQILHALGHNASISREWNGEPCDMLIALHARRSRSSIEQFRLKRPEHALIVALTGTDFYNDLPLNPDVQDSLQVATRVVVLQSAALELLPEDVRRKACVIYQSAISPKHRFNPAEDRFDVCVLSHLREVKDPLRAAFASRFLPSSSKIRIVHAGRALDSEWEAMAKREQAENARYRWIGEQSHDAAMDLLANCRLFVLSSAAEGGANAIAEAVVCGIPVLCSDIPGNVGMLDHNYRGYFRRGDTEQLAEMLYRAETDAAFLGELRDAVCVLQHRFSPREEEGCWNRLLLSL